LTVSIARGIDPDDAAEPADEADEAVLDVAVAVLPL